MAKGMLSLTVALLLSAMCTVEGQSASGAAAAAAGSDGGLGGAGGASAAAAASAGGGDGGPGYGGGRYLPYGYRPQYANSPYYTYLPRRYTSSYVVAPTVAKKRTGLGFIDDILNHAIKLYAFNNSNGAPNPANTS